VPLINPIVELIERPGGKPLALYVSVSLFTSLASMTSNTVSLTALV
jgi:hypothetical protein